MQQPGVGQMIGEMVIPGMIVATMSMVLLIVFVYFIGRALGYKTSLKITPPPSPPGPAVSPIYAAPQAAAPDHGSAPDTETMAVITAAISCVMDTPYAITNVTPAHHTDDFAPIVAAIAAITAATAQPVKSRRQRPVWGFAGMQQNTRPF